jgi:hypothetical protein
MRLQIDTTNKTVTIVDQTFLGVTIGDFMEELMELLPNDWQEYKLVQSEGSINWPTNPVYPQTTPQQPQTTPQQPQTNPFGDPYNPQIWYSTDSDVVTQAYREHRREGRDTPTSFF